MPIFSSLLSHRDSAMCHYANNKYNPNAKVERKGIDDRSVHIAERKYWSSISRFLVYYTHIIRCTRIGLIKAVAKWCRIKECCTWCSIFAVTVQPWLSD
ncbi:hypothetical protein QQG55_39315 [Brugia pahangi]